MHTIEIPSERLDQFKDRASRLKKKADRLGVEFSFNVRKEDAHVRKEKVLDRRGQGPDRYVKVPVKRIPVDVEGKEEPTIDGWEVAARLDFEGDEVIVSSTTEDVQDRWRDADRLQCDHCGTRRHRKVAYIIRSEEGKEKQVGSTCLKDYVGHPSAEDLANLYVDVQDLTDGSFTDFIQEEYLSSGQFDRLHIVDFLKWVYVDCARRGYVSRSKSGRRQIPTADQAETLLRESDSGFGDIDVTVDHDEIEAALDWAKSLNPDSDYEHNIKVLAGCEYIDASKHAGYVASILPAYRRHKKEIKEAQKTKNSKHVGEEGDRLEDLTLELTDHINLGRSKYGRNKTRSLFKFVSEDGNVFCWFTTSNPEFTDEDSPHEGRFLSNLKGETFRGVRATVKDHDEYEGTAQTTVSRVYFPDA